MFLPATQKEFKKTGQKQPDIILITGDAYIDSPYIGIAIIGKTLEAAGFSVAVIAQPDINSSNDITRFGEPRLFWGVTSGAVDSMVANYTATKKHRKQDDFTPGGLNNRRPDRAVISYSNLIRQFFKKTRPIVIGGIEASLRRISHYDYWSNKIRRSVLFDAKADILVYGMGETAIINLAYAMKNRTGIEDIKGICYISKNKKTDYILLPAFEDIKNTSSLLIKSFKIFYDNNDPATATGLIQKHDLRFLIQNPPSPYLSSEELDKIYEMDFERDVHPLCKSKGNVKAAETIKFSITSHRGCYGECNFCAIGIHQGHTVISRSESSILKEAESISKDPVFKGYITDIGGPTANMYGFECSKKIKKGKCIDKRCIFPSVCKNLKTDHSKQLNLLNKLRKISKIKKIFIASGIRYDLISADRKYGEKYIRQLTLHHVSGQIKTAPEHCVPDILNLMGKQKITELDKFCKSFNNFSKQAKKAQFITYYFIAAHPGCTITHMKDLKRFTNKNLKINPEQVQIFTPTPSTYSTLMYATCIDPFNNKKIFVEKDINKKYLQKDVITNSFFKKQTKQHFDKKKGKKKINGYRS